MKKVLRYLAALPVAAASLMMLRFTWLVLVAEPGVVISAQFTESIMDKLFTMLTFGGTTMFLGVLAMTLVMWSRRAIFAKWYLAACGLFAAGMYYGFMFDNPW